MTSDEPRWTVRLDGRDVHLSLRARTSVAAWGPHLLLLAMALPSALVLFAAGGAVVDAAATAHAGRPGPAIAASVVGGWLAALYVSAYAVVRGAAWLSWNVSGHEEIVVREDAVEVRRSGFGIARADVLPRRAGDARPGRRPPFAVWGLPRPGERGGLAIAAAGGEDLLVGLDLTRDEADAIAAEIDLIRRARSESRGMHRQGAGRHLVTPRVLVFCERDGRRLYLEGAAGKWFAGRLNGLGGSVERGEDVAAAAAREVEEECGLRPQGLRLAAVVHVDADPQVMLFVFLAALPPGDVRASAEGRLVWHDDAALRDPSIAFLPDVRDLVPRLAALPPGAPPLSLAARW